MIRFLNAYFPARTLLLGASEAFLVTFGFVAAAVARLGMSQANLMLNYQRGFLKIVVVAAVFTVCMYYFDLYDSWVCSNKREVLTRLVQVFGTVCILMAVLYYVFPLLQLGREIFFIGFIFVALLLVVLRQLFMTVNAMPKFAERALILGDGPLAKPLMTEIETRAELGIRVVGQLSENGTHPANPADEVLGTGRYERLSEQVEAFHANRIIIAMGERRGRLPIEALLQLKGRGVRIQDGAEIYEAITGKLPVECLRLSWLLFSPGFQVSRFLLIYKRTFSLVVSLVGIVVTTPLMALIAVAIRLDSPGPVVFRQKRVGQGGAIFTLYKFRTMLDGADRDGRHKPAEAMDARFTRVGGLLRRTRLDELPQLFNILCGDMYFVGPRPFVPDQEQECLEKIPHYSQRWAVKPGATGWAQINRGYNATIEDNVEKLAYDLFYIKNMSVGLDLLILFKTTKTLILGRGSR
ncbi:MAG: TIGR03013 family XrtA/PEP-CTERM system glycosyltransferase [Candidatus Acidiferrales bacterium]